MKPLCSLLLILSLNAACPGALHAEAPAYPWLQSDADTKRSIARTIPPPRHAMRVALPEESFGAWLRGLPLRPKGSRVRLFDGTYKAYQAGQVAVVDMDVGERDLQQCADAVIRLRAEYLWAAKAKERIAFKLTNGMRVDWTRWSRGERVAVSGNETRWRDGGKAATSHRAFRRYLDFIFSYAGSASLQKELKPQEIAAIEAGDVLIQGGHPGHAVLVLDVARHARGHRYVLLGQSYMPAQDFHVLANPQDAKLSPWYRADTLDAGLQTPEWGPFLANDLRRFAD